MTFQYRLTREELLEAVDYRPPIRRTRRLVWRGLVGGYLVAVVWWAVARQAPVGRALCVASPGLLVLAGYLFLFAMRRQFRQVAWKAIPGAESEMEFAFSPAAVMYHVAGARHLYKWSAVIGFRELRRLYLLSMRDRYILIPKRVFTPRAHDEFFHLLRVNVPTLAQRLPAPRGPEQAHA